MLTNKQIEILILIYRFRFLNRVQIQKLLNHKKYNRIIVWLNELTENKYLNRYTPVRFKNVSSIYSLGTESREYFKNNKNDSIQVELLSRVWKERQYSIKFRNHCTLLADTYISLLLLVKQTNAKLHFHTKTDLSKMKYLVQPEPDATRPPTRSPRHSATHRRYLT